MKRINRQTKFLILILVLGVCTVGIYGQKIDACHAKLKKVDELNYQNTDGALALLTEASDCFLMNKDTAQAIIILKRMATVNGNQARYKNSYDNIWKALALAVESQNEPEIVALNIRIGRYYSYYKREKQALTYFAKSLDISKKLDEKDESKSGHLAQCYYAYCQMFRESGKWDLVKIYLDSCYQYYDSKHPFIPKAQLDFEKATLLSHNNQHQEAQVIFDDVEKWADVYLPTFNVLVHNFKGLNYQKMGRIDDAEKAFKKALDVSTKYNSHLDFSPLVHENLSKLYAFKGDYAKAYQSLRIEKNLDEAFFDSRSKNNWVLLEIQDEFRVQKEKEEQLIQKQRLENLEYTNKISALQRTILIGLIAFLLILGFVYIRQMRINYRNEKTLIRNEQELIRKKQELEINKVNEVLELKNKEMIASALKLIEKDEIISDFKASLAQDNWVTNPAKLKKMIKSLDVSQDNNWREFETRFVSVNESFYDQLHAQFPDLTPGESKLCGLIKLNLASKDMSKLMGISVTSVHTVRYRLRKKLGLSREDNLTEFISNI